MKNFSLIALAAASLLMFGCETNVAVESEANPVGNYSLMSGDFEGQIAGTVPQVLGFAKVALEKDLGYMLTGQQTKNPTEQKLKARMRDDRLVVVTIYQKEPGVANVIIELDDSDLISCHQIFNAIAKRAKAR